MIEKSDFSIVNMYVESLNRVLKNETYVETGFKSRECSTLYKKGRKEGAFDGKIISKVQYDAVKEYWESDKKSMIAIRDSLFDEEKRIKYEKVCEEVKKVENTEEWQLVKLHVDFMNELKKQFYKVPAYIDGKECVDTKLNPLIEKAEAYFSFKLNKEYKKLFEDYSLLSYCHDEAEYINNLINRYDKAFEKFLSGTIVQNGQEFVEAVNKLKEKNINTKKR